MTEADHYRLERYKDAGQSLPLRTYYRVRPLLPRPLQLALRRGYTKRQGRREFPGWPIEDVLVRMRDDELRERLRSTGAESVPLVGHWPDGHRFAWVLTHDVEGPAGVEHIPAVRALEARYGLVSSWNFCAEQYPIPEGLFDRLREEGCEIGLHGIDHRGRLFASRERFEADLPAIHRYMREWGADGFRSPALHRVADWMPELACSYDTSFPDTDPYEPQPGGCCSIRPFFNGDLVELPVTLAQDHTLFEILGREDIGVWTEKSAWLAEQGGLVNVIIHPDYMLSPERMGLYEELLRFLGGLEGGWHALPRDVAAWWRVRDGLRIEGEGAAARVAGPGAERATVFLARERDGAIAVEPAAQPT